MAVQVCVSGVVLGEIINNASITSGEYRHQPPSHLHDGRPTQCILPAASTDTSLLATYTMDVLPAASTDTSLLATYTMDVLPAASRDTSLLATYTMDALLSVLYQRRVPTPASQPLTRWTPYSVYSTSGEYRHQPPSIRTYTMDALLSVFYQRRVPTLAS